MSIVFLCFQILKQLYINHCYVIGNIDIKYDEEAIDTGSTQNYSDSFIFCMYSTIII